MMDELIEQLREPWGFPCAVPEEMKPTLEQAQMHSVLAAAALEAKEAEIARKDAAMTKALEWLEHTRKQEMFLTGHLFIDNARNELTAALQAKE